MKTIKAKWPIVPIGEYTIDFSNVPKNTIKATKNFCLVINADTL